MCGFCEEILHVYFPLSPWKWTTAHFYSSKTVNLRIQIQHTDFIVFSLCYPFSNSQSAIHYFGCMIRRRIVLGLPLGNIGNARVRCKGLTSITWISLMVCNPVNKSYFLAAKIGPTLFQKPINIHRNAEN